jgi:2-hydroxychromene-2-carboxylate isomerase
MPPVVFYFDFYSPYSYLAHSQLEGLGAPVRLVPIRILEVMKLVNNAPTTITCAAKGAYARKDLARWASRYGVTLQPCDLRALDGALLLRIATAADGFNLRPQVVEAIYKAVWGGAGDVTANGIASYLNSAGLPGDKLVEAGQTDAAAAALDSATTGAAEIGVFGAPTLRVGDEIYFGNDRLDFVREAIAAERMAVA